MKASIPLILALCAGTAAAAEPGFYVGAGLSSVSGDYAPTDRVATPAGASGAAGASGIPFGPVDSEVLEPLGSSAWRVLAGYRVLDWLAVEGSYNRFAGHSAPTRIICVTAPCPARESADVDSSALSVLALYPRGPVDFFARVGLTRWQATLDVLNPDGSLLFADRESGTDPGFGAGVQFHAKWLQTRLEYERLRFGDDEADLFSFSVAYTF